uniref:Uncharacterized protein n=1 Tax=Strix occidentalis caurina TaxID=311401 RepID=A0A8D0EVY4_STROC
HPSGSCPNFQVPQTPLAMLLELSVSASTAGYVCLRGCSSTSQLRDLGKAHLWPDCPKMSLPVLNNLPLALANLEHSKKDSQVLLRVGDAKIQDSALCLCVRVGNTPKLLKLTGTEL